MKRFLKLVLFSLIVLFLVVLSRFSISFSNPLAYATSAPLCGICPGGGLPNYGYSPGSDICNLVPDGTGTYCGFEGNVCMAPVASLPNCTGITISPISSLTINVGNLYTFNTGSFTDQFVGPFNATVDYGDGSRVQTLVLSGYNFSLSHLYQSVGVYPITVTVGDSNGMPASVNAQVNVINVAPIIGAISVNNSTVAVNTAITAFATFSDSGDYDTHTAVWDWGDGVTTIGTVTQQASTSGFITDSHAYAAPGVYTITLKVTDKYNATGVTTYQYISVYDPSGSFLTGSGTFPSTLGDLKFGVHAKYVNNSFLPKGEIELELKKGKFEFETSNYQWLVISGNVAYVQGTGKLNDSGNYNILLTAVDGKQTGTADLIRIQITDPLTNTVVFDSEPGSPIYAVAVTPITRGSIKIHH